ncbi:hypothetical protein R1flu_019999 [Riccia fluitans]|uniref:Methyltransferase n=1 Tax=Riccia fluitans TaxID=41844 RepID=A0ABD1ZK89_9MARC
MRARKENAILLRKVYLNCSAGVGIFRKIAPVCLDSSIKLIRRCCVRAARDVPVFQGPCRQHRERPPLCIIPTPLGYQRPGAWLKSTGATSKSFESAGSSLRKRPTILSVGCQSFKEMSSAFGQEDASTLTILGVNTSGACIQSTLDNGLPALLLNLLDASRLPTHSFDLVHSDECGEDWNMGGLISSNLKIPPLQNMFSFDLHFTARRSSRDYCVWRKNEEDKGVNGLVGLSSRNNNPAESSFQAAHTMQYNHKVEDAGATSMLRTRGESSLYDANIGLWRQRVALYIELLGKHAFGQVRNVLGMNAGLGSFAVATMEYHPVWVLNVVPKSNERKLDDLYARGLLGVQHDWSEAFPTPPRSYDLVHSSWTFSHSERGRALVIVDVVLEVDRILRPGGLAIFRDTIEAASKLKLLSGYVRWQLLHEYLGETEQTDYVLIFRKKTNAERATAQTYFVSRLVEYMTKSPWQQTVAVSTDQEDQQRKGDDYERRAANEVHGWGMFSGDYEKAIQFLEKACSFYKPSKAFEKLAAAQMKIARCFLKMGNVEGGASTYVSAAKHYKRIQQRGAVTCLSRAAMLFEEIGELSAAGRYYQELGEMSEAEGKISESIGHYRKAGEVYLANESIVLSNQCRSKVAKQAAELERYEEAITIFEALAKDAVSSGASKKTKEMFLYAGLCRLCSSDCEGAAVKQALRGFQEVEPTFTTSRESKILLVSDNPLLIN